MLDEIRQAEAAFELLETESLGVLDVARNSSLTGAASLIFSPNKIAHLTNATPADDGVYTYVATNPANSVTGTPATLAVVASTNPGRLTDFSRRAQVGTGGVRLIVGFVVGGRDTSGAESLPIRASGPALVPFGVAGVLSYPQLQLYNASGALATNGGWGGNAQVAATAAAVGRVPLDRSLQPRLGAAPHAAVGPVYGAGFRGER